MMMSDTLHCVKQALPVARTWIVFANSPADAINKVRGHLRGVHGTEPAGEFTGFKTRLGGRDQDLCEL